MCDLARKTITVLLILWAGPLWSLPIPRLELTSLENKRFVLPVDAQASVNVLVIGFTQKAGENNKPWIDRLGRDFPPTPRCATYSVAILTGVPALFRSLALSGMRNAIPTERRSMFLSTFTDEKVWKSLVGYQEANDPYLVLLDASGQVLLQVHGLFTEARYQQVADQINLVPPIPTHQGG